MIAQSAILQIPGRTLLLLVKAGFGTAKYERLLTLKRKYDPDKRQLRCENPVAGLIMNAGHL
jgi:hypothetical protein